MEEDIKILEEWIEETNKAWEKNNWLEEIPVPKEKVALENLIKGYRELEEKCQRYKESKDEYKNKYLEVTNFYLESVPYSTIKEKIEELEKYIYKGENAPQDFLQYRIKAKIQVLQELMEGK